MRRRKEKQSAKAEDEEDLEDDKRALSSVVVSSSEDEEANEDLTLKIEEKAQWNMKFVKSFTLFPALTSQLKSMGHGVSSGGGQSSLGYLFGGGEAPKPAENNALAEGQVVNNEPPSKKAAAPVDVNKQDPASIHSNKTDGQNTGDLLTVITAEEQETIEAIKASETNESPEASAVQMSDNIVLRKLLRGPRYFDPPDTDSNWGTCVNCGEGGHTAVHCKAGKRKKPCFVCGSFEHAAKQCKKARDCFICKKGGHQAKDCPEKITGGFESARLCLKCGVLGHEMFQCNNSYSSEDFKEIQCYVCREFGHLCCVDSKDGLKREVSCYKCGQLGHNGPACTRFRGETTGAATPSSCSKCGEEGYFARECRSCAKARKHHRLVLKSLKIRRRFREEKDYIENGSAPTDIGNAPKRKKIQNDGLHALAKNLLENQSVGKIG
ncbi:hypothetical protein K1719_012161 [Acacia pycnantha]|nr:hypothetical protein K1719_012161 [Acacia pycnantha]